MDALKMEIVDGVGMITVGDFIQYNVEKVADGFNVNVNMDDNEFLVHFTCNSLRVCEMRVKEFL